MEKEHSKNELAPQEELQGLSKSLLNASVSVNRDKDTASSSKEQHFDEEAPYVNTNTKKILLLAPADFQMRVVNYKGKIKLKPVAYADVKRMLCPDAEKTESISWCKILESVDRYEDDCLLPGHGVRYEIEHISRDGKHYLNRYHPTTHVLHKGHWPTIENLIRHIFVEQYEKALDYIQLRWVNPKQKVPILILVSKEQGTGKTTFMWLISQIFQDNAVSVPIERVRGQFNSFFSEALFVLIDEAVSEKGDNEKFKMLATAFQAISESKGKDAIVIDEPFTAYILCTNNEDKPIYITKDDNRFWVRKVAPLTAEEKTEDADFKKRIQKEIPAFLNFLEHRELSTKGGFRTWFYPDEIKTDALLQIIKNCANRVETSILEEILNLMETAEDDTGIDIYKFCVKDLQAVLRSSRINIDLPDLRKLLKRWGVSHIKEKSSYTTYLYDSEGRCFSGKERRGKYYTLYREDLRCLLGEDD